MGKFRWASKKSQRTDLNLRAAATALSQAGQSVLRVHWTPILARGRIHIHVCDPEEPNPLLPRRLNNGEQLAKFIENVLPEVLRIMKEEHAWTNLPRVVVHDKASYMVNAVCQQVNPQFAEAMDRVAMRSWVGQPGRPGSGTAWLCGMMGDVYVHETAISHIRRLLSTRFVCLRVDERFCQFKARMLAVQAYMNSEAFAANGGRGLLGLCQELRSRCEEVVRRGGARIPK